MLFIKTGVTVVRPDTDLTFKSVCDLVKSKADSSSAIDGFDKVAGALLLLSPAVLGPTALPALSLLGAKNELTKLGKQAWGQLKAEPLSSRLTRFELLSVAYGLTCYTAFFEAVEAMMAEIYEEFGLTGSERLRLSEEAAKQVVTDRNPGPGSADGDQKDLSSFPLELPHPTSSLEQDAAKLGRLYRALSEGLLRFIQGLAQWDEASESRRDRINVLIRELPDRATEMYKGQYLALCVDYNEFCVWANLREHELTRARLEVLNARIREIVRLREQSQSEIDLGLKRVAEVLKFSADAAQPASHSALKDLTRMYQARIEEPIIRDEYESLEGEALRYPSKAEIFVPQSFRALRYSKGTGPLEDEKAWMRTAVSEDIGAFLLSYLSSPHSITAPLVALGHPGSGKSLLTEIIAARLSEGEYTPIRVELRDINADSEIQIQLEEQMRRDTGRHVDWVDVAEACTTAPPLIVLDGYDELLQASGRVFSTYLQKVAAFQRRELQLGRPVKVLVTSRITLIDKAEIPPSTTIMRLEDFDAERQRKWINTWNSCNFSYFSSHGLMPLSMPVHENLRVLAQQPLLLLMLALYDSEDNKLAGQESIDQTLLYDTLLRRFIDRERRKGEQGLEFGALTENARAAETNRDMLRLGVAAIGMYNRRTLHIAKDDLQGDIAYFETSRAVSEAAGPVLNQAELLLGSFFFVHESRSRVQAESSDQNEGPSAFEFLHNTFGEFLTADFILSAVLEETEIVRNLRGSAGLEGLLSDRLRDGNISDRCYSSLMFTPLYTRPVILSMLKEWGHHRLVSLGRSVSEFAEDFDAVMYGQLTRLLQGVNLPSLVAGIGQHPFPAKAVLDYAGIFTLNLVLIRTAVVGEFQFDSRRMPASDFGHPWDRMTYVWRAALGLGGLEGLSRVVRSKRNADLVSMTLRADAALETSTPLEVTFETASALGDELLMGLAGWALQDAVPASAPDLDRLSELTSMNGWGLEAEISRRAYIRRRSMYGASASDQQDYVKDGRFSAGSLNIDATSTEALEGLGLDDVFDLDLVLSVPAEFGPALWRKSSLHVWLDRVRSKDDSRQESFRKFISERALTAAECISTVRSFDQDSHRTHLSSMDARARFAFGVAQVALGMARRNPAALPGEVALELLACLPIRKLPEGIVRLHLGEHGDPWTLTSRSSASMRKLMAVSHSCGEFGLIEKALTEMSGGRDGGPRFVHACGMPGALTLLEAGTKIGFIQQQSPDNLNGVLNWILRSCDVEDALQSLQSILSVLRRMPHWADQSLSPRRLCDHFGIVDPDRDLGASSLEDLKWLADQLKHEPRIDRQRDVHRRLRHSRGASKSSE